MEARYAVPFVRRQEERRERSRALSRAIVERLRAAADEATASFPSITRLYAFGSVASDRATEASDVDLLVEGIAAVEYYPLRRFLSERLEREVDLHTDTEPLRFVEKVRARGRCVFERSL
jgi:predicted nucleotidyltransferase